ncbi:MULTISPECIES: M9 family metallopeptidase [Vibrio]|uniref:M9 family metallopeptidase n=1 Tax=Vibrio TaxID=662 RepID=UPI0027C0F924|nr:MULTISPECIES: M9 family metallopeptidase [unclassified Vibrio]EKO3571096.1 collagenase [Vibrio metschnikovii]MDQ2106978.1 collagenase [Vibrio sp. 2017_1457_15]MDQ2159790.1 collagenase [Vibrio sp. 2017_1457_13]
MVPFSLRRQHPLMLACLLAFSSASLADNHCYFSELAQADDRLASIKHADHTCYSSWYSAGVDSLNDLYSEQSIAAIQRDLMTHVGQYQGQADQAKIINNLSEFIRAAYYVRFYAQGEHQPFSQALNERIAQTINQFLRSPHVVNQGREQVSAFKNMSLMADSIKQLPLTMDSMMALLEHFTPDTAQNTQWVDGLNNLFRAMAGHIGRDEFYQYLAHNPQHIDTLERFAQNNQWALTTDAKFLVFNAIRETGRLLASSQLVTRQQAKQVMLDTLQRYPLGSEHETLWLAAVEMLQHFAPEAIADINIEAQKDNLAARILPNWHQCDGPAIVRSQDLTIQQEREVCSVLNAKEQDFHQVINSGGLPVADDLNDKVEVVVFANNQSYVDYSAFLFNNTTDNGGQYLEGNPADPNNRARFIAYRYANGEDALSILNLEHEYVHYLDGRFNLYGGFGENLAHGHIVWWLEGFAEYMHYKQGYDAAIRTIQQGKMSLSDVMATTYSHDTNRIYRWGYLAVRYMLEAHPQEVDRLLALARQGQYAQWAEVVKQLGTQYDEDFSRWLDTLNVDEQPSIDPTPEQPQEAQPIELEANQAIILYGNYLSEQLYYIDVPERTLSFQVTIDGQGDADLYMSYEKVAHYYDYQFSNVALGSNERLSFKPQADGYVQAGRYYISVTGRAAFSDVKLLAQIQYDQTSTPSHEVDDLNPIRLEAEVKQNLMVNQRRYAAIYVPEGVQRVQIWMTPTQSTTNNVDLFASQVTWPSRDDYQWNSVRSDSHEYLSMPIEKAGYIYFTLDAQARGENVDLVVYFD